MSEFQGKIGTKDVVKMAGARSLEGNLRMKGHITIINAKTGEVVREIDNVVTTVGLQQAAGLFNGVDTAPFKYIAIGTGTTGASASDTALESEITTNGGARQQGTASKDETVAKVETTFNFTGDLAITEIGLFDAASGGNMAARQVFAVLNVKNGDTFTFRWEMTFSAA